MLCFSYQTLPCSFKLDIISSSKQHIKRMAHLAWAAASSNISPSPPPTPDYRTTIMSLVPAAPRRSSVASSWSVCSTLVEQPLGSPDDDDVDSSAHQLATPARRPPPPPLSTAVEWDSPSHDADSSAKRRSKMGHAWQKVKNRLSITPRTSSFPPARGEFSPLMSPRSAVSPVSPARHNRRSVFLDFRGARSPSLASSADSTTTTTTTTTNNNNRHSWQSSSSSASHYQTHQNTTEMLWGSMAAGFII